MGKRGFGLAIESVLVLAGATAVIALLGAVGGGATDLRGDQEVLNLIVQKRLHPEILPRDALYGSPAIGLYTPLFISLQTITSRSVGGDPVSALSVLIWPFGVLFVVGHYVLFRSVTGSPAAAALGAVSALTIRNALAGEYWGFDGLRAIQPRTAFSGLVPLLLLLFLRWRGRRDFPVYFLGLGLLINVHPVGAFHLAQVTGAGHLWLERFGRHAWRQVAVGALLFVAGTLPLTLSIYGGREPVTDPAALAEVRAALDYRFPYMLYPVATSTLMSITVHVALLVGATAWLLWRRGAGADLRRLLSLAVIAGILGLGGTAVIQGLGHILNRPYVDILQMRATKLVYPVLLAALAGLYAHLLRKRSARGYLAVAALFLLALVPPATIIHAPSLERRNVVERALGIPAPPPVEAAPAASMPEALAEWARAFTPADSLFFTDLHDFRARALRSITGTAKDGGWQYLGGPRPFHAWYVYIQEVDRCRALRGRSCWFELALRYDADYVVQDPGVAAATPVEGFTPTWAQAGWAVWRREPRAPR